MKKKSIIFALFCILLTNYSCNSSQIKTNLIKNSSIIDTNQNAKINKDSIKSTETKEHNDSDMIDTTLGNIKISITKFRNKNGINQGVCIRFHKKNATESEIYIAHPLFSDIIFSKHLLGVSNKNNSYVLVQFELIGDSVLVLPLIGLLNKPVLHIINLNKKKEITEDYELRNSTSVIWFNKSKNEFIITEVNSESSFKSDKSIKCLIKKYRINKDEIKLIKERSINVNYSFIIDDKQQFDKFIKF